MPKTEGATACRPSLTAILRRHGLIEPSESAKHEPYKRFEHEAPNDLWQMDFKGHIPIRKPPCRTPCPT